MLGNSLVNICTRDFGCACPIHQESQQQDAKQDDAKGGQQQNVCRTTGFFVGCLDVSSHMR